MNKFFVFFTSFIFNLSAIASHGLMHVDFDDENWLYIGNVDSSNNSKVSYYADLNFLKLTKSQIPSNEPIQYKIRTEFNKKQTLANVVFYSSRYYRRSDCSSGKSQLTGVEFYERPNLQGEMVLFFSQSINEAPWENLSPGTAELNILNLICGYDLKEIESLIKQANEKEPQLQEKVTEEKVEDERPENEKRFTEEKVEIDGAFGYSLGDVEIVERTRENYKKDNPLEIRIYPSEPIPGLRDYFIDVTRNANRIYRILATTVITGYDVTNSSTAPGILRSCSESSAIQPSIYTVLNSLESKYGEFTVAANNRNKVIHFIFFTPSGPYNLRWRQRSGFEEYRRWEFKDGNRSIILRCGLELDKKGPRHNIDEVQKSYFVIELEYIDHMLEELVEKEKVFRKQWFQNENEKNKNERQQDIIYEPEIIEI